jgi:hypothetical protein
MPHMFINLTVQETFPNKPLSKPLSKQQLICRKRFPPGPAWVPLLGSVPFLRGNGIEKFVGPSVKKYGKLSKKGLMFTLLIVLNYL